MYAVLRTVHVISRQKIVDTWIRTMDVEALKNLVQQAKLDVDGPIEFPLEECTMLNLTNCGLSSLPSGFEAAFPNLSILFLSKNCFEELPAVIGKCVKLQMVAFKSNGMKSIHRDSLQAQLRWLILTDNDIEHIPQTIGNCPLLQKCMLSGNKLKALPKAIEKCKNLELIRLASNRLTEAPMELLQLPKLAWVALSDNPFLQKVQEERLSSHSTLSLLSDVDYESGEILGQGAGGITRKAMYNNEVVAVKTYGANMTSDGLPAQERKINSVASSLDCSALIKVLGETQDGSLVMEFLNGFKAIAGPPSFESCSRDVYHEECKIEAKKASRIVSSLLQALRSLHQECICHGDFYGHNILVDDAYDEVRLSDFGAAFFYERDSDYATLLQNIELRAFAIFVEEMKARVLENAPLLDKLADVCKQSGSRIEDVFIACRQFELADMATAYGAGVSGSPAEEKE